jgi:hypothetical protein
MSVTDVSQPSYASSNSSSRLLVLKLHDGRTSCKAMEHKTCPQLTDSLAPGSKVRCTDSTTYKDYDSKVHGQSMYCLLGVFVAPALPAGSYCSASVMFVHITRVASRLPDCEHFTTTASMMPLMWDDCH